MKNSLHIMRMVAAFTVAVFLFTSCDKDIKVDVKSIKVNDFVEPSTASAEIEGDYEYPSILKGIDVYLSKKENMDDAKSFSARIDDHHYSVKLENLIGGTKYYYCYEFNNGMDKSRSDVKSFNTKPYSDAAINTDTIPSNKVTAKTAVCGGTIVSTAGSSVVKYGVCYAPASETNNPTIYNITKDTLGDFVGHFSMTLSGLRTNTDYYVRAYFISSKDYKPVYGQAVKFKTKSGIPSVSIRHIEEGIESAVCTYAVYDDNGLYVSEHGICWSSTNSNPSLANCEGHKSGGESMGSAFAVEITQLTPGKEYYLNIYYKNEDGNHTGPTPSSFMTHTGTPVISDFKVTRIKYNSALLQASFSDDGHYVNIVSKGFLWSKTIQDPKIDNCDDKQACEENWVRINRFEEEQEYYVRPYVKYNGDSYAYGSVKRFKTPKIGGLTGAFSINNSGDKVCFSQSNLEFKGQQWCFGENQWEYIGTSQGNSLQGTDRDLFGWGTSGYQHGAEAYYPWATIAANTKYWAYGKNYYHLFDGSGQADWGYNHIHIPSLYTSTPENDGWRTMTNGEWLSLVNKCRWDGRFSAASIVVNGQTYHGYVLLPDNWSQNHPDSFSFTPNALNWTTNTYTKEQWYEMEAYGAVFLPAAGFRYKSSTSEEATIVGHDNQVGYYWSSSSQQGGTCWKIVFDLSGNGYRTEPDERYLGHAVRLVKDL